MRLPRRPHLDDGAHERPFVWGAHGDSKGIALLSLVLVGLEQEVGGLCVTRSERDIDRFRDRSDRLSSLIAVFPIVSDLRR
jgi:hypothetical protein